LASLHCRVPELICEPSKNLPLALGSSGPVPAFGAAGSAVTVAGAGASAVIVTAAGAGAVTVTAAAVTVTGAGAAVGAAAVELPPPLPSAKPMARRISAPTPNSSFRLIPPASHHAEFA
jgi:hypothetical protein